MSAEASTGVSFLRLLRRRYYTFDADNNGFLDSGELRRCLNSLKLAGDELDLSEQEKDDYGAEYVRPRQSRTTCSVMQLESALVIEPCAAASGLDTKRE